MPRRPEPESPRGRRGRPEPARARNRAAQSHQPATTPPDALDVFRQDAQMTHAQLWAAYYDFGGLSDPAGLKAVLTGVQTPTPHERNLIAHALNDRFERHFGTHPVPYVDDEPVTDRKPTL